MELLPRGELHPDCLPTGTRLPKCERDDSALPDDPILDVATLPADLDLFRLAGFLTVIIGTERFVETVRRLGYEQDVAFRELAVRVS